jgi:hypothetical protein
MTKLAMGEKVKVRYVDERTYRLDVEVIAICPPNEFIGRVEAIFIFSAGEMLEGGQTFNELMGQAKTFKNEDIVLRQQGPPGQ